MQLKKPQLLCKDNPDLANLEYPYYAIPKLDGIRCLINESGQPVSRTLKLIPNKKIQCELRDFADYVLTVTGIRHGFDGELICGSPTDKDVYRTTNSVVMSHDKTIPVKYFVFDIWSTGLMFDKRLSILQDLFDEHDLETKFPCVHFFNTGKICNDEKDVLAYEEHCILHLYACRDRTCSQ